MKITTSYQRAFVGFLHRTVGVQAVSRDGSNLIVRADGLTYIVTPYGAS